MNIRKTMIVMIVMLLFAQPVSGCSGDNAESSVLSDTQIAALRDQYPVNGLETTNSASYRQPDLSYLVKGTSSYVIAQIIGKEADTHVPGRAVDDSEIPTIPSDFTNFTIRILDTVVTSDFLFESPVLDGWQVYEGQELVVSFNQLFPIPKLEEGMSAAIMVTAPVEKSFVPMYQSMVDGLYYIVDKHVISGYEELKDMQLPGMTLDKFISEVVEIRNS